jgi:hypothetical protein
MSMAAPPEVAITAVRFLFVAVVMNCRRAVVVDREKGAIESLVIALPYYLVGNLQNVREAAIPELA